MTTRRLSGTLLVLAVLGLMLVPAGSAHATFPGTNGRIAFADGFTGQIYAINPDGTGLVQLTHTGRRAFAGDPAWSPDGQHIVFVTDKSGRVRLWIMDADGSNKRMVADDRRGASNFSPTFTPDGARIVYTRCITFTDLHGGRVPSCRLYSIGIDGTGRVGLTNTNPALEVFDFDAAVSPDGTSIAFSRFNQNIDGILGGVYVMDIDGSNQLRRTPPELEGFVPDWFPDGSRVAFTSDCCRLGSNGYVMNPDGTNIEQLTSGAFPHNDFFFRFSPAGDRMVFASDRSYDDLCCSDMFVMKADGSQQTFLDTGLLLPYGFSWGTAAEMPEGSPSEIRSIQAEEARFRMAVRCSSVPRPLRPLWSCD